MRIWHTKSIVCAHKIKYNYVRKLRGEKVHMPTATRFIGRDNELQVLEEAYRNTLGKLVAIYGRRRIGKSRLIKQFVVRKSCLLFEGLEKASTPQQLVHFTSSLRKQTKDSLLTRPFATWDEALNFLTERHLRDQKHKVIIVFDELQWLAVGRSTLVSLIKHYWDNFWSQNNVMLILCGSISSFMVNKVIHSKALYGRISYEICLKELEPVQARAMLRNKFTCRETVNALLCFGAIPKYLEEINPNLSLEQNIVKKCFQPEGFFFNEYEKVFYSQFREHRTYERIVKAITRSPLEFSGIAKKIKVSSGGGLSRYIKNLEQAQFVSEVTPFGASSSSKSKRYQLTDPYLHFYLKFIAPNRRIIRSGAGRQLLEKIKVENLDIYFGFAFERFCVRYARQLAEAMEFSDYFLYAAPYFKKAAKGYQIDLLFERSDNVIVIAEVKYSKRPISTQVVPEVERKVSLFRSNSKVRIQKALISLSGPSQALRDVEYFDYFVSTEELFQV